MRINALILLGIIGIASLVLAGCLNPQVKATPTPTPSVTVTPAPTYVAVVATPTATAQPTPAATATPAVEPTATVLIKDYRCFDGTPQNACSKVQVGRYCNQYLAYNEDCRRCGCPEGTVCTNFNVCRTPG